VEAQAAASVALDASRIVVCGVVLSTSVSIALARPRLRALGTVGPGHAAVIAVAAVLATGSATPGELAGAYRSLVRPLSAIAGIMVMTACVHRSGLLTALASRFLSRSRPAAGAMFTAVFLFAALVSSVLNNDAMILLLTPLVLTLAKRSWPGRPGIHLMLAYAVFAAIGVAPVVIANPINLLVADQAGIGFNPYLLRMAPAAAASWLITWCILAVVFRRYRGFERSDTAIVPQPLSAEQRRTAAVLVGIVLAYPIASLFQEWAVAVVSVAGGLILVRVLRAPLGTVLGREVEWGILLFMLGAFAIGVALRNAGVVDALARFYHQGGVLALAGVSAAGSAVLNNHPMTIINLLALQSPVETADIGYLIILAGGDIGPRLLPSGSLAGLLWLAACRRTGLRVSLRWFVVVGLTTLVPALIGSVAVLLALNG
jgi:arsenical pump membrane protein